MNFASADNNLQIPPDKIRKGARRESSHKRWGCKSRPPYFGQRGQNRVRGQPGDGRQKLHVTQNNLRPLVATIIVVPILIFPP